MLRTETFTFNPFQENTYLVYNDKKMCWIVDPGMYDIREQTIITDYIAQHALLPQAIINTHTHIDHIFGVRILQERYNIPFLMHQMDLPVLANATASALVFSLDFGAAPKPDGFISEQEPLLLGTDQVTVRLAPGHSPGSIVFYYPDGGWVISGDVLFNSSIGRTDLPGGNHQTLIHSIQTQMLTLPADTLVLPGHGSTTTIGYEQQHNPFL